MITMGGNAELELVDTMDPFSEGINFAVMPPKKSWKAISNLSGGEKVRCDSSFLPFPLPLPSQPLPCQNLPPPCLSARPSHPFLARNTTNHPPSHQTLSSLALVFALHVFKPTPLYFMDEIDAALDFRNVSIVANYIKDRTKNAQFIIISLRWVFILPLILVGCFGLGNE